MIIPIITPRVLQYLDVALAVIYASVFVWLLAHFVGKNKKCSEQPTQKLISCLICVHITYFVLRTFCLEGVPFSTRTEFISLVALGLLCTQLALKHSEKGWQTGIFFVGIAVILQIMSHILQQKQSHWQNY